MFDMEKVAGAVTDLDSRLEQIANQGRITNGLLALLVLNESQAFAPASGSVLSEQERIACIALIRTAFNDPTRILNDAK